MMPSYKLNKGIAVASVIAAMFVSYTPETNAAVIDRFDQLSPPDQIRLANRANETETDTRTFSSDFGDVTRTITANENSNDGRPGGVILSPFSSMDGGLTFNSNADSDKDLTVNYDFANSADLSASNELLFEFTFMELPPSRSSTSFDVTLRDGDSQDTFSFTSGDRGRFEKTLGFSTFDGINTQSIEELEFFYEQPQPGPDDIDGVDYTLSQISTTSTGLTEVPLPDTLGLLGIGLFGLGVIARRFNSA